MNHKLVSQADKKFVSPSPAKKIKSLCVWLYWRNQYYHCWCLRFSQGSWPARAKLSDWLYQCVQDMWVWEGTPTRKSPQIRLMLKGVPYTVFVISWSVSVHLSALTTTGGESLDELIQ